MGSFGFLRSSGGVDSGAPETEQLPSASSIARCCSWNLQNIFEQNNIHKYLPNSRLPTFYVSGRHREEWMQGEWSVQIL